MTNKKLINIESILKGKPDEVPKGWLTIDKIAKQCGWGRSKTERLIRTALEETPHLIKVKEFYIKTARYRRYPVNHYFFK